MAAIYAPSPNAPAILAHAHRLCSDRTGLVHTKRPGGFELNAEFVRRLDAALPPGSSAVCLIVPNAALTRILPELRRFGGTLLETPIERAVVARFRGSPPSLADHAADAG